MMMETFLVSIATFFATIGPIDVAAMFAALTAHHRAEVSRHLALKGIMVATGILLVFAFAGEWLLRGFGISLAALRVGGGILLLLIGIDMTFARHSGGTSTTAEEITEAEGRQDISVFPLGTPLIAGPGAISAVILLMANAEGQIVQEVIIIGSLLLMLLATYIMLLLATPITRLLGITGMQVITRIFGVLLTALAAQFMIDGIAASGLLN